MNEEVEHRFKQNIQAFFDEKTITIVGSGLSCAEGLPGMSQLSEELIKEVNIYLNRLNVGKKVYKNWEKISNHLKNGLDLETTLQKVKPNIEVENAIIEITNNLIYSKDYEVFLQVVSKKRQLKFAKYISEFNNTNLVVITTNYDLLIEYSCESIDYNYFDSFKGNVISKFTDKNDIAINKNFNYKNQINIYKPHGSINWKIINNEILKINNFNNCQISTPCIITPGSNKYEKGYSSPFNFHINKMREEIDKAKKLVFIGYGFNDNHLEQNLKKSENLKKPKLIITKALSENAIKFIENSSNTIAIEEQKFNDNSHGTKVYFENNVYELKNKNIWDLNELIEYAFYY